MLIKDEEILCFFKKKKLVLGWNVAQLIACLLAPGFIPKQSIKWACWYRPLIPVLRKWRPEGQELKVILDEFWTSLGYIRAYKNNEQRGGGGGGKEEEGKESKAISFNYKHNTSVSVRLRQPSAFCGN